MIENPIQPPNTLISQIKTNSKPIGGKPEDSTHGDPRDNEVRDSLYPLLVAAHQQLLLKELGSPSLTNKDPYPEPGFFVDGVPEQVLSIYDFPDSCDRPSLYKIVFELRRPTCATPGLYIKYKDSLHYFDLSDKSECKCLRFLAKFSSFLESCDSVP